MGLFDRMPYLLVALSPECAGAISHAIQNNDPPPSVKVLHVAAYVDPPSREDIQLLYSDLWNDENHFLQHTPIVLIRPAKVMKEALIVMLYETGIVGDDDDDDDDEAEESEPEGPYVH